MKYAKAAFCIFLIVTVLACFHYVQTRTYLSALREAAADGSVTAREIRESWDRGRAHFDLMWRGVKLDAVEEDLILLKRAEEKAEDPAPIRERILRRVNALYRSLSPSFTEVF